ncbi:hypothetical protein ACHAWF_003330, partial [Thalassiosira exigua]
RRPTTAAANDDDQNKLRYAASGRSHIEDAHVLNPLLYANCRQQKLLEGHRLFAVFDGHGGDFTSHVCGERAYLRLLGEEATQRIAVEGLGLLKAALTSAFVTLDAKLMDAQRALRVSQLHELEDLVTSLNRGKTSGRKHDVFREGTEDRAKLLNFDPAMTASMPSKLERSGSTGVVVLIAPHHVLCANAGDSRAVLSRRRREDDVANGEGGGGCEVLPLSFDHKPHKDVEVSRVERDGGFVRAGRVDGDLAVSRSFGDFGYKWFSTEKQAAAAAAATAEGRNDEPSERASSPDGSGGGVLDALSSSSSSKRSASSRATTAAKSSRVTACPDVIVHTRDRLRDEFVILACDGIWDRLTNRECADLVRELTRNEGETDVGLICEEILDRALKLDSKDNMTCCAIVFPGATTGGEGTAGGADVEEGTDEEEARGVMKRRRERERAWGPFSTPAKRAQERLEARKRAGAWAGRTEPTSVEGPRGPSSRETPGRARGGASGTGSWKRAPSSARSVASSGAASQHSATSFVKQHHRLAAALSKRARSKEQKRRAASPSKRGDKSSSMTRVAME